MFLPVTIIKSLVRGVCCNRRGLIPYCRVLSLTKFGNSFDRRRFICTTQCLWHGEYEWQDPKNESEIVYVNFVDKDGKRTEIKGKVGDNVLYLAHR